MNAFDDDSPLIAEFIPAGDERYPHARMIENMRLAGTPRAIARCRDVAEVQAALAYARDREIPIAVRAGGHSAAGWSSIDDGLVIDLSLMRTVEVDPEARSARVGGGTLATDLVSAASEHGLAPVTGIHTTVGLGGLLLGLGEGYLTGRHGFGVDNVTEVELVTAAGDVRTVSPRTDPDLFWAVRGAGANFGVVTAMTLALHPAPRVTLGGTVTFGADDLDAVTDYAWNLMRNASLDSWPSVCFSLTENGEPRIAVTLGHVGDEEEGRRELDALRAAGTPLSDTTSQMSYPQLVSRGGAVSEGVLRPRGAWALYRFPFDGDIPAQKRLVREQQRLLLPSPATYVSMWRTPNLPEAAEPSAAPRYAGVSVFVRSMWDAAEDDEKNLAWFARAREAFSCSGLVGLAANTINHVSQLDGVSLPELYGSESYERLVELKSKYDPSNMFSSNANIPPAAASHSA